MRYRMISCSERMPRAFHDIMFGIYKAWEGRHAPVVWKQSAVILLHKKGDPTRLTNWRPIAFANCTYKLYTGTVTKLLTDDAEYRKVLNGSKEGFRRGRNTHRQLSHMLFAIEDATLIGQPLHVLYLDFENAFGSPDHGKLLQVLKHQGFLEDALKVVNNLYPGGDEEIQPMMVTVRTKCGENESFPVRRGTIQGDTLSPLLFILFLDPLIQWLDSGENGYKTRTSNVRISSPAFADDMALTTTGVHALGRQLRKVEIYSPWGGPSLNVPTCAVGGINVKAVGPLTYKELTIGGTPVPFLPAHVPQKYLGVQLRLDLISTNHFDMIYNQVKERAVRMAKYPASDVQGMQMIAEALRPVIAYSLRWDYLS
jgi:hypothetical protein